MEEIYGRLGAACRALLERPGVAAEQVEAVSVTAQIPISALQQAVGADDLEQRLTALIAVLTAKGLVTEAELAEALKKAKPPGSSGT